MKRKWLWICYFGLSIAIVAIVAIMSRQHVVLNWFSLFPVGYILICILLALFFPSKYNARLAIWSEEQSRIKWGNKPLDAPYLSEEQLVEMGAELNGRLSKACLAFIPAFIPFAIFFTNTAKVLSVLTFLPLFFIFLYFTTKDVIKTSHEIHDWYERERKKQEQREQWGRWK